MIFFLLALPRFSPLFCPNLGGQLPPPPPPASYAYVFPVIQRDLTLDVDCDYSQHGLYIILYLAKLHARWGTPSFSAPGLYMDGQRKEV